MLRPCCRSRQTTSVTEASRSRSCFPVRIDQCRGNRFARRFAAPQHELEDGIEALALLDGGLRDRLGLLEAEAFALTRVEDGRMPEHHQARSPPHFKVAEPQLLVDEAQRL